MAASLQSDRIRKLKMRKLRQAIKRRMTTTTTYRSSDVLALELA